MQGNQSHSSSERIYLDTFRSEGGGVRISTSESWCADVSEEDAVVVGQLMAIGGILQRKVTVGGLR